MRRILGTIPVLGLLLMGATAIASMRVSAAAAHRTFATASSVAVRPVALVLGAGVKPNGTPTDMLADRVRGAAELYRAGKVSHLLLSGDNSRPGYDEPTTMRRLALELGVPAPAITLDFAGFSTRASCVRAKTVFGVSSLVVVTQQFHAARAVYLCRAAGIDAVALALPTDTYATAIVARSRVRESAARFKALLDVGLHRHTVGGPFVGLPGSTSIPALNARHEAVVLAALTHG